MTPSANSHPREPLTPSQEKVLGFIRERCDSEGAPPSFREIQAHFGYRAVGTVQDHVKALVRKGYLEKSKLKRRARGLLPAGRKREAGKRISVFGEIAAGSLRDSPQVEIGSLVIADHAAKDPCFALRVVGDSMIEAGIHEGDFVVVEQGASVRSGDIVVALVEGETTVKRYVLKKGKAFLVPENARLKPIAVESPLVIQGKVVALQRRY